MSRVKVILNYVDLAHLLQDIKKAETLTEVAVRTNRLGSVLDMAAKQETAEYLKGEKK